MEANWEAKTSTFPNGSQTGSLKKLHIEEELMAQKLRDMTLATD